MRVEHSEDEDITEEGKVIKDLVNSVDESMFRRLNEAIPEGTDGKTGIATMISCVATTIAYNCDDLESVMAHCQIVGSLLFTLAMNYKAQELKDATPNSKRSLS